MKSVMSGNLSINRAAENHGLLRTTLQDQISGRVQHGKKLGSALYLTLNEEKELVEYLLGSAELGYVKTRREVIAGGKDFGQEPYRSGDAMACVRMSAVNKENITGYFNLLKEVFDQMELSTHPECIYNMDETSTSRTATSKDSVY